MSAAISETLIFPRIPDFAEPVIGRTFAQPGMTKKNSSEINKTARRANHFRFTEIVSSPRIEKNKKYFAFAVGQISGINLPILLHQEGRSRSSRNAGQGVMDVEVSRTNGTEAYGEDVWS